MTIYEYFGYPREIVQLTFKAMTYNPLKDNFKKRWGENLERDFDSLAFTKQDYSDFSNRFEKLFKNNLAIVLEYYNMGYSENEIISALKRKEKLRFRLPVFKDIDEMCSIFRINQYQLVDFLEQQNHISSRCFQYYYGFNHPKLDIVSISKLLDIEVNSVIKNIYSIYKNLIKKQKLDKKILKNNTNSSICDNEPLDKTKSIKSKRKDNFLDYFEEEHRDFVLEILEHEKTSNTKSYQSLMKIYSEDYILKEHPDELIQKEYVNISNLKRRIQKKLEKDNETESYKVGKAKRKINYLDYFEEQDKKYVLEILEQEKIDNTKRYHTLMKIYDEDYILRYNPERLDKNDYQNFYLLIKFINKKVKRVKEVETMIECQKEKIRFRRWQKTDIIDLSNMSVYEMDKYYLENLELFKENYPLILFTILKHGNFTVKEIIEKSFLKDYMELMTDMEKAYFYLKLKSYQDSSLTDKKIEQILDLTEQDLEEYELSTKSDFLNKMNVLVKPSK